jgi:hypothetical protein
MGTMGLEWGGIGTKSSKENKEAKSFFCLCVSSSVFMFHTL